MNNFATKRIVRISYFVMLSVIGGLIRIPFGAVSLTLQTVFVVLSGFFLGSRDGAYAQIVYVLLGLIGLPVFTTGGGIDYVFRPTFGYIASFPIVALIAGRCVRRRTVTVKSVIAFGITAVIVNYAVGITYQVLIIALYTKAGFYVALTSVTPVIILLIKDIALVVLLAFIYPRLNSTLKINTNVLDKNASDFSADNVSQVKTQTPNKPI